MAAFESGVIDYVHAQCVIDVYFPADKSGTYIRCQMCKYYNDRSCKCSLTGEVSAFPTKYVGDKCPLTPVDVDPETGAIKTMYNNLKEKNK